MTDVLETFCLAWILTQVGSFVMLEVGTRFADHRCLRWVGQRAHQQKMAALDRVWPLTRIRAAAARGDTRTCVTILGSLIAVKSAASLLFGLIMVFWLPLVSVMVPSIVAVHDPDDPSLLPWIRRVAALQVTSHALAAALGFALTLAGPLGDQPLSTLLQENIPLILIGSLASLAFAVAAGVFEARGVVQRGL